MKKALLLIAISLICLSACQPGPAAKSAAVEECGNQAQARYDAVQDELQQCRTDAINRYGEALEECGDPDPEQDYDAAWAACVRAAVDQYNEDRERCVDEANQKIQEIIDELLACVQQAVAC